MNYSTSHFLKILYLLFYIYTDTMEVYIYIYTCTSTIFPDLGSVATVRLGPPAVSST